MEEFVLFDDPGIRGSLLPFTFTRPVADIRIGILKISEKWEHLLQSQARFHTQEYLQKKFPPSQKETLWINGAWIPDTDSLAAIKTLSKSQSLYSGKTLLAAYIGETEKNLSNLSSKETIQIESEPTLLQKTWNIFQFNGEEIVKDFHLLTEGRKSARIEDPHTIVYNESQIFLEEGVKVKAAVLNAENGPIYLGKGSEVQEGAIIRGPFSLGESSVVNMGAKIRGDSTVGPHSKVGGEVGNSVIFGFSNKGHEGYLGNSVLGEWCNLGADTNTSNLKNNYAPVKVWEYTKGGFANTGLQFCGLMMGDHSKCGINTMFNTGTVVGVGANIFGSGFPRNFVPSFSWGGSQGFSTFRFPKFKETAEAVMKRRSVILDEVEESLLKYIYDNTKSYRIWEKSS
ncbi:GlmU family protein [Algoriphagus sediminis]|uniref:GlmU family protein n=1 Tax=Algoriphagus sediminis TaxID=3057113 RepID=A0ABT7Y9A6_9BACT|nr:GlmU family protein [Algoriphagus sediminis]MDN3203093.1 GlmU family protein [Algoriphagus sediminis]